MVSLANAALIHTPAARMRWMDSTISNLAPWRWALSSKPSEPVSCKPHVRATCLALRSSMATVVMPRDSAKPMTAASPRSSVAVGRQKWTPAFCNIPADISPPTRPTEVGARVRNASYASGLTIVSFLDSVRQDVVSRMVFTGYTGYRYSCSERVHSRLPGVGSYRAPLRMSGSRSSWPGSTARQP